MIHLFLVILTWVLVPHVLLISSWRRLLSLFFPSSIKNFNSDLLLYTWAGLTTEKQARPICLFCSLDWLRPKPENPKINSMAWLRFRFTLSVLVFVSMFFTCTPSKKSKQWMSNLMNKCGSCNFKDRTGEKWYNSCPSHRTKQNNGSRCWIILHKTEGPIKIIYRLP